MPTAGTIKEDEKLRYCFCRKFNCLDTKVCPNRGKKTQKCARFEKIAAKNQLMICDPFEESGGLGVA